MSSADEKLVPSYLLTVATYGLPEATKPAVIVPQDVTNLLLIG